MTTTKIHIPAEIIAYIVEYYDDRDQPIICMEELAELQQAISKRCRDLESNLPEEIAHSLISISVLMTLYGIKPGDVEAEIKKIKGEIGGIITDDEDDEMRPDNEFIGGY